MLLSVELPATPCASLLAHFKGLKVSEVGRDRYRATMAALRGFLKGIEKDRYVTPCAGRDALRDAVMARSGAGVPEPEVRGDGLRYYRVTYYCVGSTALWTSEVGGDGPFAAWANVVYTECRVNNRLAYHCVCIQPL